MSIDSLLFQDLSLLFETRLNWYLYIVIAQNYSTKLSESVYNRVRTLSVEV